MKNARRLVLLLVANLALGACAVRPKEIDITQGTVRADRLATLRVESHRGNTQICKVHDARDELGLGYSPLTPFGYHRVDLAPGKYNVQLCGIKSFVTLYVHPGTTYIFSLANVMDSKAVQVAYREVPSTSPEATIYAD